MSVGAGRNGDGLELRALVCDDEPVAREYLKLVLSRIDGVRVVGEASDAAEALKLVGELRPDVAFLDINLPGASGVDAAEALSRLTSPPKIVFVTGYDEHAVSAFELAAVDYVMKPFDQDRLDKTIRRIRSGAQRADAEEPAPANGLNRLPIKDRDSVKLVDPKDICYIRTEGRSTRIRTTTEAYVTHYTIAELESRLAGSGFFRANEGCLVNLERIKEVVHDGPRSHELLMNDPDETFVPLSRSRAQKLKEMLNL